MTDDDTWPTCQCGACQERRAKEEEPLLTCPWCGQGYRKNAGHCTRLGKDGCCSSFRNDRDFDLHRTGAFHDGSRRCLTVEERLERGWEFRDGLWASPQSVARRVRVASRVPGSLKQPRKPQTGTQVRVPPQLDDSDDTRLKEAG